MLMLVPTHGAVYGDAVATWLSLYIYIYVCVFQDLLNVATIASGSTVMGGIIAKAFEKVRKA